MTPRAWRALAALALGALVAPALVAVAAPDCSEAADARVRACSRWDSDWPLPGRAPFLLNVRVEEGATVTNPDGVPVPDSTPHPRVPRVPGTPAVPRDLPGVPPAVHGEHGSRHALLVLAVDAAWDWPPGDVDVTVWGALAVGRDFVPVNARVQWVDGNADAVPDAVAVQGPFALVVPVAL